jgi:DNA-binding beta-propeller fold protein YncE
VSTDQTDVSLSAGEGVVVASNPGGVAAIDPKDLRVLWKNDVPGDRPAVGFGSVWTTDFEASVVHRLDVRTGAVQAEIVVPGNPIGIVVHRGYVWVAAHRRGTVSRIDPAGNKVASVTRVGPTGPGGPMEMSASGDDVYVAVNNSNRLVTLDAATGGVARRFSLPDGLYACGSITPDHRVAWVSSCLESDHVARVDLRTGRVARTDGLRLYAGPGVVRGALIWFAGRPITPKVPAGFVGVDRATGDVVGRLAADDALDGAVLAFGSWWVAQGDGVARFTPEDFPTGP